jgi:hypothetical protein
MKRVSDPVCAICQKDFDEGERSPCRLSKPGHHSVCQKCVTDEITKMSDRELLMVYTKLRRAEIKRTRKAIPFDVPESVMLTILSSWIDMQDLCRYDSAVCNYVHRADFLRIISLPGFTVSHDPKTSKALMGHQLSWVLKRGIRLSYTQFFNPIKMNSQILSANTLNMLASTTWTDNEEEKTIDDFKLISLPKSSS